MYEIDRVHCALRVTHSLISPVDRTKKPALLLHPLVRRRLKLVLDADPSRLGVGFCSFVMLFCINFKSPSTLYEFINFVNILHFFPSLLICKHMDGMAP